MNTILKKTPVYAKFVNTYILFHFSTKGAFEEQKFTVTYLQVGFLVLAFLLRFDIGK